MRFVRQSTSPLLLTQHPTPPYLLLPYLFSDLSQGKGKLLNVFFVLTQLKATDATNALRKDSTKIRDALENLAEYTDEKRDTRHEVKVM